MEKALAGDAHEKTITDRLKSLVDEHRLSLRANFLRD